MAVVIFIREQSDPLVYEDADSVTIVATGHLQLYKRGQPDQQLGGVFAGDWTSYRIQTEVEVNPPTEEEPPTEEQPPVEEPPTPVEEPNQEEPTTEPNKDEVDDDSIDLETPPEGSSFV